MLTNTYDREDAQQDIELRILRHAPKKILSIAGYKAWAVQRRRLDHRRAEQRRHYRELKYADSRTQVHTNGFDDPAIECERKDYWLYVRKCIKRLPQAFGEPLTLHYLHGMTVHQTASALGVPAGAILYRLKEGRRQLRSVLGEN